MTLETEMLALGAAAKQASAKMRLTSGEARNDALSLMATEIRNAEQAILGCLLYTSPSPRDRG